LNIAIECQALGLLALLVLALMELYLYWFNSEFVWLVPLVLIAEEVLVARRFARRSMMECDPVLPCDDPDPAPPLHPGGGQELPRPCG
jgi:hypothetical protein